MGNTRKLHIITDLDGVVVNTIAEVIRYLYRTYGIISCPEDFTNWCIIECVQRLAEQQNKSTETQAAISGHFESVWTTPSLYRYARAHHTIWASCYRAMEAGAIVRCLTHRPVEVEGVTQLWLQEHGLPSATFDVKIDYLPTYCAEHADSTVVFLEDNRDIIDEIDALHILNLHTVLVARPWNKLPITSTVLRITEREVASLLNRYLFA